MLRIDERAFELTKMGVDPSAQGRGYGHRLMQAAIDFARRRGAERIVIRSHTSLKTAVALYREFGFAVTHLGSDPEYARCNIHMALDPRPESPSTQHDVSITWPQCGSGRRGNACRRKHALRSRSRRLGRAREHRRHTQISSASCVRMQPAISIRGSGDGYKAPARQSGCWPIF
jgi:predicted GNAT family acetyltransferase